MQSEQLQQLREVENCQNKNCREIDKERRIIGIRAQKGIVNFQAFSFRCVKDGTSRIRIQEE